MNQTPAARLKHDIAYACFIPPGLVYLIGGISQFIALDTGTAGGFGFLILIPLTIAALIAAPIGIYFSVSYWRDPVLMFLATASVLMLVQLFAEVGTVKVRNLLGLAYGAAVFVGEATWFLARRRHVYAS